MPRASTHPRAQAPPPPPAGEPETNKANKTNEAGATGANGADGADGDESTSLLHGPLGPDAAIEAFLAALDLGEPWYPALLDVVARWVAPAESLDGAPRDYLIGGEAFDWLALAERLIDAAGDRVPADEAERLLFRAEPPDGSDEEAFARAIGTVKHRAHLNFQYGVVVEEALLLSAELELLKARTIDPRGEPPDVTAYERIYGKTLAELISLYRGETGQPLGTRVRQAEWQAFTYWCSKYRFKMGEPARVASDTRKALALLSRLHSEGARPTSFADPTANYIDAEAVRTE